MKASFQSVLLAVVMLVAIVQADILWKDVCTQADVKSLPFCDTTLDVGHRAADYV
jgi:hypothetical protein